MLKRSIIIEGPDGAGKTRLFTLMTETWELKSAGHDGGPPVDAADSWSRLAMFAAMSPAVRDRCPAISDPVYSAALNRRTMLSVQDYSKWMREFQPYVIFCRPPTEVILSAPVEQRLHKPAEFVDQVRASRAAIIAAYDRMLPALLVNAEVKGYLYNWTTDPEGRRLFDTLVEESVCVG